jgi:segregation and condensation protein B
MIPEEEGFEPLEDAGQDAAGSGAAGDSNGGPHAPEGMEEPLPDAPLRAVLEAMLFAGEEPLTLDDAAAVLGEDRRGEIEQALSDLRAHLERAGGGLRVQAVAGGFRITTDPNLGPFVRALVRSRNRQRLSRAALETLAIVAYKQPITAPEIQEIRGVNPSAILASLLDRRLIRILGRKKVVGKPFVYGTTREFLIRFGLNSVEDLPSMEEFEAMLQETGDDAPPPPGDAAAAHEETTGTGPEPAEP